MVGIFLTVSGIAAFIYFVWGGLHGYVRVR